MDVPMGFGIIPASKKPAPLARLPVFAKNAAVGEPPPPTPVIGWLDVCTPASNAAWLKPVPATQTSCTEYWLPPIPWPASPPDVPWLTAPMVIASLGLNVLELLNATRPCANAVNATAQRATMVRRDVFIGIR